MEFVGCQVQDHPWAGEPYQEPPGFSNPQPTIYAPMPTILPSVDATAIETDETIEKELGISQ